MLVSIIMPVYNGEKTILCAIESVMQQSYSNWELIIVDDCSLDKTYSKVSSIIDDRVRFFQLEANTGSPALPRNFGLSKCKGKYVAFLDADDLWEPEKLELQVDILEKGYNVVCSNYSVFLDDEKDNFVSFRNFPKEFDFRSMLKRNCIGNLTGIYNKENLGIVLQKNQGHEDYIMWLELVKNAGKAYCVQKSLARYRITNNSVSSDKVQAAKWQWKIYRDELGLSLPLSSYYFSHYAINTFKRFIF
ncbi:glycosyltransferase family 2 protein [Vibrio parahaemolyticus]|uniref:glycosyltransferase family 2 protein n=1 Tax=Vibrio parahaemolyticus TaxID=670 RepID=UPI000426A4BB|nr:glycosyltransferase [Vibrio parahaemolyticus]